MSPKCFIELKREAVDHPGVLKSNFQDSMGSVFSKPKESICETIQTSQLFFFSSMKTHSYVTVEALV